MFSKILDVIFGKSPDIFDEQGNVLHKFPESKWKQWNDRFHSAEYNWREHRGTKKRVASKTPPTK